MDGAFSPFATGCRVGVPRLEQASPRPARRAASLGCISLVTFFVHAKKVTRPCPSRLVQRANVKTGEMMPPFLVIGISQLAQLPAHFVEPSVGYFARSNNFTPCKQHRQRASNFSCSCKKSHQKNTPPRFRPCGASHAVTLPSGVGSTRHPCRAEPEMPIHGHFTPSFSMTAWRNQGGGKPNPRTACATSHTPLRLSPPPT